MTSASRPRPSAASAARRARRRVLAEWRRVDLSEAERARISAGRSAADLLPAVLQGMRIDRRQAESQIVSLWRQIVDPRVAEHSHPVGLVRGTLLVAVDSSVWLTEIVRYGNREILERVQHAMGKDMVKKISFRVG
ncbi:MAG: DUF721 domain-containing protein [Verrucomicrobiota bacterium]